MPYYKFQEARTAPVSFSPLLLVPKLHAWATWASQVALVVKNLPADAGDPGLLPGWGRSPGGGYGNPLQYTCLENPTDRRTWQATVYGLARARYDLAIKPSLIELEIIIIQRLLTMTGKAACGTHWPVFSPCATRRAGIGSTS